MLCQAQALINEVIQRRRPRGAVIEDAEITVSHVVGYDQDDIWFCHGRRGGGNGEWGMASREW